MLLLIQEHPLRSYLDLPHVRISFTYQMPQPQTDRLTNYMQLLALVIFVAGTISAER